MKQLFHSIILLLAAITIASCTTDTPVSISPEVADGSKPVYLSASIDNAVTRISMEDGGTAVKLTWELDDKIYVINSANDAAYAFTAIRLSDDKKSAVFRSPDGYTGTPQYAVWSGSKVLTSYNAAALPMPATAVYSSVKDLADNYWLYAKYNTSTGSLAFKPLLSILRFDLTLPAGETSIKSFRVQMQDGTEMLHTKPTYNITGTNPVMTSTPSYNFFSDNLNIALTSNRAVLYMAVGAATTTGKVMEIIVNKTRIATQTCKDITSARAVSIKKAAANWHSDSFYSGGIGTETAPYLVHNEANLRVLSDLVRSSATTVYTGKYFRMENDITINASQSNPWIPIGDFPGKIFNGHFDGADKKVTADGDFYIKADGLSSVGLFGFISSGTIANLTFNSNMVVLGVSAGTKTFAVGGLAGICNVNITNCEHIGSITVDTDVEGTLNVGGVCGNCLGKNMINCKQTNGTITVKNRNMTQAMVIGGCIGQQGTLHECTVSDTKIIVTSSEDTPSVGTIIGYSQSKGLQNCNAYANVDVTVNGTSKTPTPIGKGDDGIEVVECTEGHTSHL